SISRRSSPPTRVVDCGAGLGALSCPADAARSGSHARTNTNTAGRKWIRITCRLRRVRRGCLPELLLETRHEHVELRGDSADSIRLTEIYAGACEKVHWIIAPA